MKTQMRFQKYICLAMIIVSALGLLYAFVYCSGGLAELGKEFKVVNSEKVCLWEAAEGKYDYAFYERIQSFNTNLMYCGIAMILLSVLLFITGCQNRRKYYVSNYVAIGVCAIGNIAIAVTLIILNSYWLGEFQNVDFAAWLAYNNKIIDDLRNSLLAGGLTEEAIEPILEQQRASLYYSDSALWFYIGFAVYSLIIVVSVILILNLVWKVVLMQGEKKLLEGSNLENATVKEAAV